MSTAPISSSSLLQELQTYFQDRQSDVQQLGQALKSGDLAGAQQDYNNIQTLAQSGPFAGGNAFGVNQREQDFTAIGQALQSGDLTGAQQAFAQLQSTFAPQSATDPGPAVILNISQPGAASSTTTTGVASTSSTSAGPEIVLNLGGGSGSGSPEEITLTFNNTGSGGEQLTIGVGSQQNPNAQQFTLNLPQNSNEQIVLNLLSNASSSTSSPATSPSSQSSGVNVVA